MTSKDNVLEKGAYNHPQPSGYITFRNYLVVQESGKRYLLIRFANESNLNITSFDFVLTQLDSNGRVICNSKITYDGIYLTANQTLSAPRGISVKEECVDFYIKVVSFFSTPYRYEYKNGQLVVHYDVRRRGTRREEEYSRFSLKAQKRAFGRLYGFISILAILATVSTAALVKTTIENEDFKFVESETDNAESGDGFDRAPSPNIKK